MSTPIFTCFLYRCFGGINAIFSRCSAVVPFTTWMPNMENSWKMARKWILAKCPKRPVNMEIPGSALSVGRDCKRTFDFAPIVAIENNVRKNVTTRGCFSPNANCIEKLLVKDKRDRSRRLTKNQLCCADKA